jgi:hypothetical protein
MLLYQRVKRFAHRLVLGLELICVAGKSLLFCAYLYLALQ